jgi:carbon storage regulator
MLVLTRREGETIKIADNITVTLQRIKGNAVRVSVEAPREVKVLRGELEPKPRPGDAA